MPIQQKHTPPELLFLAFLPVDLSKYFGLFLFHTTARAVNPFFSNAGKVCYSSDKVEVFLLLFKLIVT